MAELLHSTLRLRCRWNQWSPRLHGWQHSAESAFVWLALFAFTYSLLAPSVFAERRCLAVVCRPQGSADPGLPSRPVQARLARTGPGQPGRPGRTSCQDTSGRLGRVWQCLPGPLAPALPVPTWSTARADRPGRSGPGVPGSPKRKLVLGTERHAAMRFGLVGQGLPGPLGPGLPGPTWPTLQEPTLKLVNGDDLSQ